MEKPDDTLIPMFEVPIEPIEVALERRLHPDDLSSADLDFSDCERLYHNLLDYHQNNRVQATDPQLLRPNLSFVGRNSSLLVERACPPYTQGSVVPRNGCLDVPVDDVKRTLLFTDAVVIEDPVFAFCRGVMCTNWHEARPRFETLRQALVDIAALRPLLEKRLLRITAFLPDPVSIDHDRIPRDAERRISVRDVLLETDYRDDRVIAMAFANELPTDFFDLPIGDRRLHLRSLWDKRGEEFVWLYRQAEGIVYSIVDHSAYCPYLPDEFQYQIYEKLLAANAAQLKDRISLRFLMDLNSGCAVDPNGIGIDELVDVRANEEVFATWRETVRQAVNASRVVTRPGETSFAKFQHEVSERERQWKATFQQYNKGRLADAITMGKQVKISGFSVALTAGLLDPSGLLAFGGLCWSIIKSARAAELAFERRNAEAAALSFFAAIRDRPRGGAVEKRL
jgi:hypothetical protein